jgi:hypothetical protein
LIFLEASTHFRLNAKFFPPDKEACQRDGFFPRKDPSKLHNCKQYFWIQPDGSRLHAAYLNALEESFREEIILNQYLSHMTRILAERPIRYNIVSRDEPWDFSLALNTGAQINVEISSFTDRDGFFKRLTAEELLQRHSYYATIRLGLLIKIAKLFPDQELDNTIEEHRSNGLSSSNEVPNPYYPERPKLFNSFSPLQPLDIYEQASLAISKKQSKRHQGKQDTVLILDNRTATAGLTDFERIAHRLDGLIRWTEFSEVWLYTGYGGGHNQKFEDYLLLPFKLPSEIETAYIRNRYFG